jgi:hypothetical protein
MRIMLAFLLILYFVSCSSTKEKKESLRTLEIFIENSYEYFELSTNYIDYPDFQPRIDVERIKELSNAVLNNSSNRRERKAKFQDLEDFVKVIIKEYDSNYDRTGENFSFNLDCSFETKVRILEYIAINSITKDFLSENLIFDYYRPLVLPQKTKINVGETFNAEIYFAVNDFSNPYIVVIDNDTLSYPDLFSGDAPVFSIKATEPGKFSHDGKLIINHRGQEIILLFNVQYEVE